MSNAPKDHHSLLQLYLEGPKDKIFYIFSEKETTRSKLKVKKINKKEFFFDNKNIDQIKIAQKNAFIKALLKIKYHLENLKLIV